MKERRVVPGKIYLLTALLALLVGGCYHSPGPLQRTPLYIAEIEVTGEYDFGRLEVEVHLVEAGSGRLLGCAGAETGLRQVDSADVFYEVYAEFIRPDGGLLYLEEVWHRDLEVWVVEDDEAPCPGPFLPDEDDIIGISRPLPGEDLDGMVNLRFDHVIHLRIGS